jgi:glycopeptide antibiotics resistance protein
VNSRTITPYYPRRKIKQKQIISIVKNSTNVKKCKNQLKCKNKDNIAQYLVSITNIELNSVTLVFFVASIQFFDSISGNRFV